MVIVVIVDGMRGENIVVMLLIAEDVDEVQSVAILKAKKHTFIL